MNQQSTDGHPDRLPEPTPEQTALGFEAIRRALDGEELQLRTDREGRLCVVPLRHDEVERAG